MQSYINDITSCHFTLLEAWSHVVLLICNTLSQKVILRIFLQNIGVTKVRTNWFVQSNTAALDFDDDMLKVDHNITPSGLGAYQNINTNGVSLCTFWSLQSILWCMSWHLSSKAGAKIRWWLGQEFSTWRSLNGFKGTDRHTFAKSSSSIQHYRE